MKNLGKRVSWESMVQKRGFLDPTQKELREPVR
jgi:hypothetical protein